MTTETVEATEVQAAEIIDRDWLRAELRDNGHPVPEGRLITDEEAELATVWLGATDDSEPPEWVLRMGDEPAAKPDADAEDAVRKLQEIRSAESQVAEAESEMNAIKEELKEAKTAFEASVLRLRQVIKRHSSPQRELPFRDGPEAAEPPDDPHGDETLDILITAALRKATGTSVDGLTAKKVEVLVEQCGGTKIADLEKWFREKPHWNTDLPGFGEEWITRLQDAHTAYRLAFPMPVEGEADPEPEGTGEQEAAD